jgi:hypothetical protein
MRRFFLMFALFTSILAFAAACGGDDDNGDNGDGTPSGEETPANESTLRPVPGNTDFVVGPIRFAFGLIDDETNEPVLEDPDTSVFIRFHYNGEVQHEQDAVFVWAIPDENGFWTANLDLTEAGAWVGEAVVTRGGKEESVGFQFTVQEDSDVPGVGDPAPPTENATSATQPNIVQLTTDTSPDERLYQMTVTQALEGGRAFLVIFGTPAFCETRFCGPVLDNVKTVLPEFEDRANFIHIEPYELDETGELVIEAGERVPAQPTLDWKLRTEPWVYIVRADGTISSRFEGTASVEELTQALNEALAPA